MIVTNLRSGEAVAAVAAVVWNVYSRPVIVRENRRAAHRWRVTLEMDGDSLLLDVVASLTECQEIQDIGRDMIEADLAALREELALQWVPPCDRGQALAELEASVRGPEPLWWDDASYAAYQARG